MGPKVINLLRFIVVLPFLAVAGLSCWLCRLIVGRDRARAFVKRFISEAQKKLEKEALDTQSWNQLGLCALGLYEVECERRGIQPDMEVVETRVNMEGQMVGISFRRQIPSEACGDMRQALAEGANFRLAAGLQAELMEKRMANEVLQMTQKVRR
jgi:hypothetical protein